jgi:mannan endo-1,4-beta-mannosidase
MAFLLRHIIKTSHKNFMTRKIFSFAALFVFTSFCSSAQFKDFITTRGDKLMDGDTEFRFISCNIPNLHYIEDNLPFDGTNPWRLPNSFEIRDALTAIKQMGGKVARIYVFSVKKGNDTSTPYYVEGPGTFNEDAFRTFDTVLQIANEVGVRLIVPFVDNWMWWGGAKEYAAFRGKQRDDFWTDTEVVGDFKKTIAYAINRTNTVTGVSYKSDKAILAWETGNELVAPFSWTKEIASYIKSLDTNHLVLEGTLSQTISQEELNDPDLDILATHHYHDPQASIKYIVQNRALTKGKKPYIVGEFGIVSTEDIQMITDTVIDQGVSGALIWSLRFRDRDGGFYWHYEYNNYEAYHWPGFSSGDVYDERTVLHLLREKAHEIDGSVVQRLPVPLAPHLLNISDVSKISWQGSTGAETYTLERETYGDTSWTIVGANIDESRYQYRPLFDDESAAVGKQYSYRVIAMNESGESEPSNVVGPVEVTSHTTVDEMENFDKIFQKDGILRLLTMENIRQAKEDRSRLTGDSGSYIIYKLSGTKNEIDVDYFRLDTASTIIMASSNDLASFTPVDAEKQVYTFGKNDYGFFDAVTMKAISIPDSARYLKISLVPGVQISRIELRSQ